MTTNNLDPLVDEAKRVEEDATYSSKRHFVTATYWSRFHLRTGIPTAVLAAIAGVTSFSQFDSHNVVAGVIAMFVAALSGLNTFLNPSERAGAHSEAGNRYLALRNRTRVFYNIDCRGESTQQDLAEQLKQLANQRDELNQSSPITPDWAFEKARKGIEAGEARYAVDKE